MMKMIKFNDENLNPMIRSQAKTYTHFIYSTTNWKVLISIIGKNNKRNTDQKKDVQQSLLVDDMSMYKKNFKKFTKKLTELVGEVNKIVGYKFNI